MLEKMRMHGIDECLEKPIDEIMLKTLFSSMNSS